MSFRSINSLLSNLVIRGPGLLFLTFSLILATSSCFLGLVPNATDSNNSQGMMNALLLETDAATGSIVTLGGTVSGLSGSGLTIQDSDNGQVLTIAGDGSFAFSGDYAAATSYSVSVAAQPTGPHQTCTIANGSGTMQGSSVSDIAVVCTTNTYNLTVNVTGLAGTGLILQNNGGDDLAIAGNGGFTFATQVASGAAYSVTVLAQPGAPTQTCPVSGGSGTVAGGDVVSVTINCATNTYTIGGTVTGLAGGGLVLRNNGGDNLAIGANGAFAFATPVDSGAGYNVTVLSQPTGPHQTCNVTGGAGTVGAANVTGVAITCTTNTYSIGGTVTGLAGGGFVLQNNGGDNLAVSANGSFNFAAPIASGGTFAVTILSQPTAPWQTCNLSGGTGSVVSANITSVTINCSTNSYTVSGTVSGLAGSGLALRLNGANNLAIGANGAFSFGVSVNSGSAYNVTVQTQPNTPWQTCNVTGGSGTIANANIANVSIACVTNTYTVGGTVSGLAGSGLVLQNNGGDNLAVSGSSFTFAPNYGSLAAYNISVLSQPSGPPQICSVTNGSGTITNANITNVSISCVTQFSVGGAVSGLGAGSIQVRLTGSVTQTITVSAGASSYVFGVALLNGYNYNVDVISQPGGGLQCAIFRRTGTIAAANAANVDIACEGPPPALVPANRSQIQGVSINGGGAVATVGAGASFSINLQFAVNDFGTSNVSPVIVGIAGDPKIASYEAFCGIGTYTAPAAPVFQPGNSNLTAPTTPGVYFIRAWNAWDFCPSMTPAFTTQGVTVGIIVVP